MTDPGDERLTSRFMRTAAVLPVKRFALAKQRLGGAVPDAGRRELAAAMVRDVLDALATTPGLAEIVVVSNEPDAIAAATAVGATAIPDEHEDGQSPAARAGTEHALRYGAGRVLLVPGDCPALDPAELQGLLATAPEASVVIVPDRHGTGTNALRLTPPDVIAPSFGPDSLARHRALAAAAGAPATVARPTTLLLDVDTGDDLAVLSERLLGDGLADSPRAVRTRAWLRRHGAAPTPSAR